MENMKLWESVCVTDPDAVKQITGKQYKGHSPKPYWLIEQATKRFGPCGIGWGIEIANERFERLSDNDVLHVANVEFWFTYEGKTGRIFQMGQTKATYKTRDGSLMVDEDAPKKSVTDGMVKCMSMLGFAGDIFSGRWDDSKYVEWAADQYNPKPDVESILKNITGSASIEILKSNYEAAILMLDKSHHPAIIKAKDARKKELTQKEPA